MEDRDRKRRGRERVNLDLITNNIMLLLLMKEEIYELKILILINV
jgi:hypothetical protein